MLAQPIAQSQIEGASQLQTHLKQWARADEALLQLKDAFPNLIATPAYGKTVSVNTLYSTSIPGAN